jgi:serine/threonine protein phosphatase 1
MRLFAIGDIHGCYSALLALDEKLKFDAQDVVVVLGDYVDRGPDSRLVIEHLIGLDQRTTLIPLLGNHELMMLAARNGGPAFANWSDVGGRAALDSYKTQTLDAIPTRHWKFLESCRRFHETEKDFFVHANVDPDLALADQPDEMLFWEIFDDPPPHHSGRRMICGHTGQQSGKPLNLGHAVCIDTRAHAGGWLTCLEVRSGVYWQANQFSQIRTGKL